MEEEIDQLQNTLKQAKAIHKSNQKQTSKKVSCALHYMTDKSEGIMDTLLEYSNELVRLSLL